MAPPLPRAPAAEPRSIAGGLCRCRAPASLLARVCSGMPRACGERRRSAHLERSKGYIVLVVDDFDEARRMLAEYLSTAAGFRVESAADGRAAVELAQRVNPGVI